MKLIKEFESYLITLEYSSQICYKLPNSVRKFLTYLNQEKQKSLSKVLKKDIDAYILYISITISEKTNRTLSNDQINGQIYALKHFGKFLFNVYDIKFPSQHLVYYRAIQSAERIPLTIEEIKLLFKTTSNTKFGMRDRAMLTIFYSCGLRRTEGINVQTTDIDLQNKLIFVRKGKFGKQRFVPFTEMSKKYLEEYIKIGRRQLLHKSNQKIRKTLFISNKGEALQSYSLLVQLKKLANRATIKKNIGLHILRHSIATHLLQKGMSIYDISQFLGHSSLSSTQIYTHIQPNEVLQEKL